MLVVMWFTGLIYVTVPAEVWSPVSAEERPGAGPDVPLISSPSHPFSSPQQSPESSQTLHSRYDPHCNTKQMDTKWVNKLRETFNEGFMNKSKHCVY